jgi:hypothetical protein
LAFGWGKKRKEKTTENSNPELKARLPAGRSRGWLRINKREKGDNQKGHDDARGFSVTVNLWAYIYMYQYIVKQASISIRWPLLLFWFNG